MGKILPDCLDGPRRSAGTIPARSETDGRENAP